MALLVRYPAALNALLRGLPGAWIQANEGNETWTAFDVVGHLVHLERGHWIQRVEQVALNDGEPQTLEPVDRFAQMRGNEGKTLEELLDEFIRLRAANLATLEGLKLREEDFARQGRHPALGVVTLSELLATWVGHDLTHLHQLSRILAGLYREAAGPWREYLGVLKCAGHGS